MRPFIFWLLWGPVLVISAFGLYAIWVGRVPANMKLHTPAWDRSEPCADQKYPPAWCELK